MEGGAYITAPDYAELLLMHLRGGRCGDRQVLSPEAIDRMHADRIGEEYDGSANGRGYGMGWWIDRDTGRLSDPGAYGTTPWLDLDDRYGVSLVVEADGSTGAALAALIAEPIDEVMAATP
jgi:CubicO group peptidase (beta-lactamase class C family)